MSYILVYFLAADFLKKLKQERSGMQEEADLLRKEIENLNISIKWVWSAWMKVFVTNQ